jgi:hypothetical protein
VNSATTSSIERKCLGGVSSAVVIGRPSLGNGRTESAHMTLTRCEPASVIAGDPTKSVLNAQDTRSRGGDLRRLSAGPIPLVTDRLALGRAQIAKTAPRPVRASAVPEKRKSPSKASSMIFVAHQWHPHVRCQQPRRPQKPSPAMKTPRRSGQNAARKRSKSRRSKR